MAKARAERIRLLKVRRDAVIDEIAALTAPGGGGGAGSLPNSVGPGLHIDHAKHKEGLYKELREIDGLLTMLDVGIVESFGG